MSEFLEVYWAKTHNLKNINVKIPKNKMTVITGVSGSWKSSLAFNTIYSVWQQKYLESLSSYARMFIGWMKEEAVVDEIKWLSPTISIDQKTVSKNPRSTVWTITEIYDYYKLLFLNIWKRKCVKCNTEVKKDSVSDVIEYLSKIEQKTKFMIKSPLVLNLIKTKNDKNTLKKDIFEQIKSEVLSLWFIRFSINWYLFSVSDEFKENLNDITILDVDIIVDRLVINDYSDSQSSETKRLKDSLNLAFKVWKWKLCIKLVDDNNWQEKNFSNIFVCWSCWHTPEELTISSFTFNSHSGACPDCHWLGVKKVFFRRKYYK